MNRINSTGDGKEKEKKRNDESRSGSRIHDLKNDEWAKSRARSR